MRTMKTLVFLSLPLVATFFGGCAADVKVADENARPGTDQQLVEGSECIQATLPASGCIDYGDLKMQAHDACQQAGMQLVALTIEPVDGCNNVTEGAGDYQCCPVAAPEPPDPGTCTSGTIGDGTCQSHEDLKMAGWDLCKQSGFVLTDLVFDDGACPGDSAISAAYECCSGGTAQPPPPPSICASGTIGNGSCQGYADFKMAAHETCEQAGFVLFDVIPDPGACADGEAISASYACTSSGPCP